MQTRIYLTICCFLFGLFGCSESHVPDPPIPQAQPGRPLTAVLFGTWGVFDAGMPQDLHRFDPGLYSHQATGAGQLDFTPEGPYVLRGDTVIIKRMDGDSLRFYFKTYGLNADGTAIEATVYPVQPTFAPGVPPELGFPSVWKKID